MASRTFPLLPRQSNANTNTGDTINGVPSTGDPSTDAFLKLLANPFQSQIQSTSFIAALVYSFAVSGALMLVFCFLRPRTNAVYAPRAKHADEKHRPPAIDNGLFSWIKPIRTAKEHEMVEKLGLDAVVFLRFLRMLRNIFLCLSVLGCAVIIPINYIGSKFEKNLQGIAKFMRFTPQFTGGKELWAFVIIAYAFDFVTIFWIWWNYKAVLRLRRAYFNSNDYKLSLHSRTLMMTHIPTSMRTDDGLTRIAEETKHTGDMPRAAVARNVKDLPELIEEHEETVKKLEKYLAKHLANPEKLPAQRPTCKPSRRDKAHMGDKQVDAIDYLTDRVRELEREIIEVRETIDKRNPMSYGFASYSAIEDAHAVAHAARKKGAQNTRIRLAPKPNDIIWDNLPMTDKMRRTKRLWNGIWMTVLTVLFIVPNILTAIFLSDFANLGVVWPAFNRTLEAHPIGWGIAQGILAPLIQTIFYLFLPSIFRRLFHKSGDTTKTSRERHVTSRLYIFFVFNNLIVFSLFATAWRYVGVVIAAKNRNESSWQAIQQGRLFYQLMLGVCQISPYWITWSMQRNLGAAVDIIQLWPLIWNTFRRRFMSPTPRELIELSAPQPFEYADYYNNYLFTATVAICFAVVQPLILPVTAFFIMLDEWLKRYLLQYVLITRIESGGTYWRMLVNRLLFATVLGNAVIALLVGALGVSQQLEVNHENFGQAAIGPLAAMLYAMIPLPFLIWAFKWYCRRTFDTKISYYTTESLSDLEGAQTDVSKRAMRQKERVGVKFGHPALYKKLITPMVSAKSKHLLKDVYRGRLEDEDAHHGQHGGYSDIYMSRMDTVRVGKETTDVPFEVISEADMDFENFKRRADFRDQFGGEGELYGIADDMSRPGTPGSRMSMYSMDTTAMLKGRRDSGSPSSSRASSRTRYDPNDDGTTYKRGYHQAPSVGGLDLPDTRMGSVDITATGAAPGDEEGTGALLTHAASYGAASHTGRQTPDLLGRQTPPFGTNGRHTPPFGRSTPPTFTREPQPGGGQYYPGHDRTGSGNSGRSTPLMDEETSYDAYRRSGRR